MSYMCACGRSSSCLCELHTETSAEHLVTAVDVDALDKLREAATHAHEPECCERCEAGERFHAGAVCVGAGCDPLLQCLRCGMPLPNHLPHDADCDAVLTITVPILAEVRRGRALRDNVRELCDSAADGYVPVTWLRDLLDPS